MIDRAIIFGMERILIITEEVSIGTKARGTSKGYPLYLMLYEAMMRFETVFPCADNNDDDDDNDDCTLHGGSKNTLNSVMEWNRRVFDFV